MGRFDIIIELYAISFHLDAIRGDNIEILRSIGVIALIANWWFPFQFFPPVNIID